MNRAEKWSETQRSGSCGARKAANAPVDYNEAVSFAFEFECGVNAYTQSAEIFKKRGKTAAQIAFWPRVVNHQYLVTQHEDRTGASSTTCCPTRVTSKHDTASAAAEPFWRSRRPPRLPGTASTAGGDSVRDHLPRERFSLVVGPLEPSAAQAATERGGDVRDAMKHGLRDASPCVYPVTSRASPIIDASC